MPDYEAHKRSALLYTSANEVYLRKELNKTKERADTAEKHVRMFLDVSDRIAKIVAESEPHDPNLGLKMMVEIENARRYV